MSPVTRANPSPVVVATVVDFPHLFLIQYQLYKSRVALKRL